MREIKFRCWDTENKEMLDVQELDYADTYNEQPAIRTTMYNDYFDIEDMILMQYTGLKDKNETEIYEGDIVYVVSEDEKAFILWERETAKYTIQFNGWCADFDVYYSRELEVIGNIYDNPELLKAGD